MGWHGAGGTAVRLPLQCASSPPWLFWGSGAGISTILWVQPLLLGTVGKWLQPSPAGKRTSFPWDGRLAAAAICWLESPLEKSRRACWLVAPSVGYLRHRLGLFTVPRKHFFPNSSCRCLSLLPGRYALLSWGVHSCPMAQLPVRPGSPDSWVQRRAPAKLFPGGDPL